MVLTLSGEPVAVPTGLPGRRPLVIVGVSSLGTKHEQVYCQVGGSKRADVLSWSGYREEEGRWLVECHRLYRGGYGDAIVWFDDLVAALKSVGSTREVARLEAAHRAWCQPVKTV